MNVWFDVHIRSHVGCAFVHHEFSIWCGVFTTNACTNNRIHLCVAVCVCGVFGQQYGNVFFNSFHNSHFFTTQTHTCRRRHTHTYRFHMPCLFLPQWFGIRKLSECVSRANGVCQTFFFVCPFAEKMNWKYSVDPWAWCHHVEPMLSRPNMLLLLFHLVKLISRLYHHHHHHLRWYKIQNKIRAIKIYTHDTFGIFADAALQPEEFIKLAQNGIADRLASTENEPILRMSTPDCGPDFTN